MSNPIHQFLIALLILNVSMTSAMAQEQPAQGAQGVFSSVMPDSPVYPVKLFVEDVEEFVQTGDTGRKAVKQAHLEERIRELEYETKFNNHKNSEKLLQKIQLKLTELEETDGRRNQEVLTNLLNNPDMPEQSKKGLMNALNKSGMKVEVIKDVIDSVKIKANMTQGSYRLSAQVKTLVPFQRVMLYDPIDRQWYSIVLDDDRVDITNTILTQPEMYLYPTQAQVNTFKNIITDINKNGFSLGNKIQLTQLWFEIKKEVA